MAEAKSKILIVEDDLDIAEMLNAYFRVQGYDVFTVNWGEDGVRAARARIAGSPPRNDDVVYGGDGQHRDRLRRLPCTLSG